MIMWLFAFSCITETVSVYKTVDHSNLDRRAEDTAYLFDVESSEVPTIEEVEAILQMGIEQVRDTEQGDCSMCMTRCHKWMLTSSRCFPANPDGLYWADTCTSEEGIFRGLQPVIRGMIRRSMTMAICLQVVDSS